jgi:hypothetical protein
MARYLRWTTLAVVLIMLSARGAPPGCGALSTGAAGTLAGGVTGAFGGAATSPRVAYAGPSPVCY